MFQFVEQCIIAHETKHGILSLVASRMSNPQRCQMHIEFVCRLGPLYIMYIEPSSRDVLFYPMVVCQTITTVGIILNRASAFIVVGVVGI